MLAKHENSATQSQTVVFVVQFGTNLTQSFVIFWVYRVHTNLEIEFTKSQFEIL